MNADDDFMMFWTKKMRPKIVTSFSLSLSLSLSLSCASTTTPPRKRTRKNTHHQTRKRGEDGGPETTTRTTVLGVVGRKTKNGEKEEEGHQSRMVGPFARRFRGTKSNVGVAKSASFFIALLFF
jgi:hypothetical protein